MRFLRRQVTNRRAPDDSRLAVDISNNILMRSPAALQIPSGSDIERPTVGFRYGDATGDLLGMIRYNTDSGQLEGYQAGQWRAFRFKEPTGINVQGVGSGDAVETYFGPIATPATIAESGVTWDIAQKGKNIIVVVENVIQIWNTNYILEQNPVGKTAGYYIKFDDPVPYGKPVTVISGFEK